MDSIQQRLDPFQLYLESFKNEDTKTRYTRRLKRFLNSIPAQIFEQNLINISNCQEVGTLTNHFVDLAKKDSELVKNIIAAYVKEDKKLVETGELSTNTVSNHIKPIKTLLDANGIPILWKSIHKLYPREKKTDDRAYTREEIQKMIDVATDITDKVILLVFSSSGCRLGSWDYFTWNDVVFFKNNDGSYKGAALLVYHGDPESYYTFITPEACRALENYREVWKSQTGKYPKPTDPLLKATKHARISRLKSLGVRRRVGRLARKVGMRSSLPVGTRRYEVALDHGFRKYFNTMMRRAKVDYLDKEDMMGHTTGLEKHYERYNEADFERFSEYQKAIPFLTVSDTERLKLQNQQLENEKSELEKRIDEITQLKRDIEIIKKYSKIPE
jgi:hypothetical protein